MLRALPYRRPLTGIAAGAVLMLAACTNGAGGPVGMCSALDEDCSDMDCCGATTCIGKEEGGAWVTVCTALCTRDAFSSIHADSVAARTSYRESYRPEMYGRGGGGGVTQAGRTPETGGSATIHVYQHESIRGGQTNFAEFVRLLATLHGVQNQSSATGDREGAGSCEDCDRNTLLLAAAGVVGIGMLILPVAGEGAAGARSAQAANVADDAAVASTRGGRAAADAVEEAAESSTSVAQALVRGPNGRAVFEGLEVRGMRDLSHVPESTLRAQSQIGFA